MQEGVLETIIESFKNKIEKNRGIVELDYIVEFIRDLQMHEYDAHIAISGQNGNGKSMLMLELLKRLDSNNFLNNIIYAFHDTAYLIDKIENAPKGSAIGIDELKKFFHYKLHATTEQIVLVNLIEYARSRCIAFIGCCNDVRRLNNNYRNSKISMVIWLLDRYDDNDVGKSYGLVFIGNPALEEEDKFQLERFTNLYSFEQIRIVAENCDTFCGYIFVDDIKHHLTQEELQEYYRRKEEGIRKEAEAYKQRLLEKKENEKYEKIFNKLAPYVDGEVKKYLQRPELWEDDYRKCFTNEEYLDRLIALIKYDKAIVKTKDKLRHYVFLALHL